MIDGIRSRLKRIAVGRKRGKVRLKPDTTDSHGAGMDLVGAIAVGICDLAQRGDHLRSVEVCATAQGIATTCEEHGAWANPRGCSVR